MVDAEAARHRGAQEAYAEESRRTEVKARKAEVEGLTFAESRGVGVRLFAGDRLGYAYAADPSPDEVREAVVRARENSGFATADEYNGLPEAVGAAPMVELHRDGQASLATDSKGSAPLDLARGAPSTDPPATKVA